MNCNDLSRITIVKQGTGFLLFLLLLCIFPSVALADGSLPENLLLIETEAFAGDTSLENVTIPEHVISIGPRAFAETALKSIIIPSSVTDIAVDSFENVTSPMLIMTEAGSSAVTYALGKNLDFRANTVCRALVIGQTDYPGSYKIDGPGKDIVKIQSVLDGYNISVLTNLTAEGMLDAIRSAFSEAKDEDISLFYYCGHGNATDGSLLGIDLTSYVTATDLRITLDSVPGRKIIIVDACYSGSLIGRSAMKSNDVASASDPAALFLNAFTTKRLRQFSTLAAQQYFVMVSSKSDEESWEASYGGIFTDAFVKRKDYGDENDDGVVTLQEAYNYTEETVMNVAISGGVMQSVQVYPENCYWFGLFR